MSKEKRRVPKLRFPGFTEDWEQREFSDIFSEVKSGLSRMLSNDDIGLPVVRANNINDGQLNLVDDIKYWYKNDPQGANTNNYLIEQGDILINFINSEAKMGTAAYVTRRPERDTIYTTNILRCKVNDEYNPYFIYSLTFLNSYKNYIASITKPAVNQASFTTVDFKKYSIKIPTVREQNQIADLIETFNKLITLHQRKLDNLKLKKKALLQKLFPKNGEYYPELRFPGFTDAWEQRKLSDISTKVTTKNVDVHYTETLTNSAEQGIISQVDFFDKEISNKDNINGYYIVNNNDFIYNPRISTLAPVGPINRNKLNRTGIMSPLYTVFRSSNVDLGFLEWYFQSSHWHRYMKLNGDSGARADRIAIKDSTFFEMPIKIPVNIKEQVLIGETLEKFNQYITLHQRKLDHLQLQKKALLQQMFV